MTLLDWFPASAGEAIRRDFDLRTGTVRLRLLAGDGATPAARRQVVFNLERADGEECGRGTTDADGWLELPPMPSTRLVPRLEGPSTDEPPRTAIDLEPFAVVEGNTTEVTRKLPAR